MFSLLILTYLQYQMPCSYIPLKEKILYFVICKLQCRSHAPFRSCPYMEDSSSKYGNLNTYFTRGHEYV